MKTIRLLLFVLLFWAVPQPGKAAFGSHPARTVPPTGPIPASQLQEVSAYLVMGARFRHTVFHLQDRRSMLFPGAGDVLLPANRRLSLGLSFAAIVCGVFSVAAPSALLGLGAILLAIAALLYGKGETGIWLVIAGIALGGLGVVVKGIAEALKNLRF